MEQEHSCPCPCCWHWMLARPALLTGKPTIKKECKSHSRRQRIVRVSPVTLMALQNLQADANSYNFFMINAFNFIIFACLFTCMCVPVEANVDTGCPPLPLSTCSLRQSFSLDPELSSLTEPAGPQGPGKLLSLPSAPGLQCTPPCPFYTGAWD